MQDMIPLVKPYIAPRDEMMPAIEKTLYSGYIATGQEVADFEEELGAYIGNPNVIALNSGTAALHIALLMVGASEGTEIISTAMTAEPTNTTIAITGAKVIWADVDPNTGLIDPVDIECKITERTKAIMVVHYAGMVCDMNRINQISQKYKIPVIEDVAHAFGAEYKDRKIGSNSKYTCFSFQAIKLLTTVDGGALAIKDPTDEEMEAAKRLRWFGLSKNVSRLENDIIRAGYKYSMNNVNASIGIIQMKHIDKVLKMHISNGKYYDRQLLDVDGISLVPYYDDTNPVYWLYTMRIDSDRESFIKMMNDAGVMASPLHHRSDTHSVFADSKCNLPGLDDWYEHFVHIPCGWWVDDEKRQMIVETIKKGW